MPAPQITRIAGFVFLLSLIAIKHNTSSGTLVSSLLLILAYKIFVDNGIIPTVSFLVLATFLKIILLLLNNIRIARATGLQYVVVPWYMYNPIWSRTLCRIILRIANKLVPEPSVTSWQRLVVAIWPLKLRHAPFAHLGTDTFLTVSPGGIIFYTADADVIAQIIARPADFPKAVQIYKMISIYGENVVSTEGAKWRRHRKLAAPAFSEKNNQLVWKATLERTQNMLSSWLQTPCKTIQQVRENSMRLSLEVLGQAGLGQNMDWTESTDKDLPAGHTMSFTSSLHYICQSPITVVFAVGFVPRWILKYSKWKSYEAYTNWGNYMKEMLVAKMNTAKSGTNNSSALDLMGLLLKARDEENQGKPFNLAPFTDSDIMGNLFLFIQAGLETTAGSIYLPILMLAMHPATQKLVQQELDLIFSVQDVSQWDYEKSLPRLLNGILGAVMNEQLRLLGPVLTIPKIVCPTPQQITIDDRKVVLPANTIMRLCGSAVHVNSKFWPSGPPKDPNKPVFALDNLDNDLEEFKPERWMNTCTTARPGPNSDSSGTSAYPATTPENVSLPYKPLKGSYIPFSDGQRVCLGRRFAQVEVLAALAVIFSQYSVELDASSFVDDAELATMTKEQKAEVWGKAEEKAQWAWRNKVTCFITVQLTKDAHVPLRIVRRGEERFFGLD